MFPWGKDYLNNKKGEFMSNFKTSKAELAEFMAVVNSNGMNEKALFTIDVKSFFLNNWGLYNMCTNTAEMIAEKKRCALAGMDMENHFSKHQPAFC
jgi:formylglycine-generating enzyme required for sulfatase activity